MLSGRSILATGSVSALTTVFARPLAALADTITWPFGNDERPMATFPGRRPLILLTERPPQPETPFEVFNDGLLTPNDERGLKAGQGADVAEANCTACYSVDYILTQPPAMG